jgi:alpha-1,2-mannosyltransferase
MTGQGAPPAVWADPFFPDRRTRRLVFGVLLAVLAVFGALDVRARLGTGPGVRHMSDFSCYVAAADALADGADPYSVTNPRGWHYLYPPLLAVLLLPVRTVPLQVLGMFWFALNVAAAAGTYFLSLRISGAAGRTLPRWLGVLPLLAVLPPAISSLQRGQISLVLLFLEMLGLQLLLTGRPVRGALAGGGALAAATAVKIVPLLPAGILVAGLFAAAAARSRPDAVRRGASAAAGLLLGLALLVWVLPAAVLGAGRTAALLSTFVHRVARNPRLAADAGILASASSNVSFVNASRHARGVVPASAVEGADPLPVGPDGPGETAALLLLAAALLPPALALAVRAGARGDAVTLAAAFGLALAAGLLLSPLTWAHQLVQLVPAISFSALALLRRNRDRAALLVAAAPVALISLAYACPLLTRTGFLGLGLAAWTAATLALLLREPAATGGAPA